VSPPKPPDTADITYSKEQLGQPLNANRDSASLHVGATGAMGAAPPSDTAPTDMGPIPQHSRSEVAAMHADVWGEHGQQRMAATTVLRGVDWTDAPRRTKAGTKDGETVKSGDSATPRHSQGRSKIGGQDSNRGSKLYDSNRGSRLYDSNRGSIYSSGAESELIC